MPIDYSKWVKGRVVQRRDWTDDLFSLQVEAPEVKFVSGQFGRLALPIDDQMVGRPYSFVNSPVENTPHEFYVVRVDVGPLSPLLAKLRSEDTIYMAPRPNGFFCLGEVPPGETLWGLSTGTALGPFMSFLRTPEPWLRFKNIVFVHACRLARELSYRDTIAGIQAAHPDQFQYIPFVSREDTSYAIKGRIPDAIRDGRLEARAGLKLEAATAQCMLCGNPDMVTDTTAILEERGLKKNKRKEPGQITVETYW
ncbi:MAG: ferredoxin--NADP reductase [Betaproteobacteria bacterium]